MLPSKIPFTPIRIQYPHHTLPCKKAVGHAMRTFFSSRLAKYQPPPTMRMAQPRLTKLTTIWLAGTDFPWSRAAKPLRLRPNSTLCANRMYGHVGSVRRTRVLACACARTVVCRQVHVHVHGCEYVSYMHACGVSECVLCEGMCLNVHRVCARPHSCNPPAQCLAACQGWKQPCT